MTTAQMIPPLQAAEAAALLRSEFTLDGGHGEVQRATLRTTARGPVEAGVNGMRTSDDDARTATEGIST
ncbi:MAG: hypothetical protein K0R60_345 [Microbacterium sp.]|jgi:alpha-L-rhamnosidase|nr:hypothetical protein [Microbacterium sp.]